MTHTSIRRWAGLCAVLVLVGCVHVGAMVEPDRGGLHWQPHAVLVQRVGATRLDGLETRARREAEDHCAELDMVVDRFTTTLVKAERKHSIVGLLGRVSLPDTAFVHASFRCMPVDRTLRPPANTPRCAMGPTGALTWASTTPHGISALFADGTLLQLHSIEGTPGRHPLHPLDAGRLRTTPLDLGATFGAMSGSYTLTADTLRLEHVRLLHDGRYSSVPTCWTELERLEVPLARPEWLEPSPPQCAKTKLRASGAERSQVHLNRHDQPGTWTDASHGPTLETPSHADLQLRVELRVPPVPGRYPIGDSLVVELLADGRKLRAVGGVLRLDIQRSGRLHGSFDELWVLSDEGERCVENVVPRLSWDAD